VGLYVKTPYTYLGNEIGDVIMENIINELFRIEGEANTLIIDAEKEMKTLDEKMQYKETEIRKNIDRQTEEQIKKLHENAHQESVQRISQIKKKSGRIISAMEKDYELYHSQWVDKIVDQVIGQ